MFQCVGEKYTAEFTKQDAWYTLHAWNAAQEATYKAWFVKHAMKALAVSKQTAEKEYSYFSLMWGWSTSEHAVK